MHLGLGTPVAPSRSDVQMEHAGEMVMFMAKQWGLWTCV